VDLTTEHVVGVEALVRWRHPTRGLVPPDGFIPVAEQHGLIQRLSRWVLENAIQQATVWLEEGLDLPVAVNLSAYDVQDATLPETVGRLLMQYALPADRLRVEVTESALMVDRQRAAEVLGRFRALGVRVAVDDFGTGYSSLAYLKQLPVDELKIDKAFVEHLASSAQDSAIVRAIVGLAHELGMGVVAEGVEDRATWQALRRAGCDTAQGYLMSRALPATDIPAWLAASESHVRHSRRAA
jgi:EAL domain-containing protein (putative c-di-GMP-specific phosphodiesterase class I)